MSCTLPTQRMSCVPSLTRLKPYQCDCKKHGYVPTEVSKAAVYQHQRLRYEPMVKRNRLSRQGELQESNRSQAHDESNTLHPDEDPVTGSTGFHKVSPDLDQEDTMSTSSSHGTRSPFPSPEPEDDNPFGNMVYPFNIFHLSTSQSILTEL